MIRIMTRIRFRAFCHVDILFARTVYLICAPAIFLPVLLVGLTLAPMSNNLSKTSRYQTVSIRRKLKIFCNKSRTIKPNKMGAKKVKSMKRRNIVYDTLKKRPNIFVKMTRSIFVPSASLGITKAIEQVILLRTEVLKYFREELRYLRRKLMQVQVKQQYFLKSYKKLKTNYK